MKFKNLILGLSIFGLAACSDNDNPRTSPPEDQFKIQVVHASQNSPNVNVLVSGNVVISDLSFAQSSGRLSLDEGTYSIQVDGITPSEDVTVIGPADLVFDQDLLYTVIALDETANIEPLVLSQTDEAPTSGQLTLQVVHAASNAPTVDIYLTAPDADINAVAPTTTLAFKESLPATDINAGDYQIRITASGSKTPVFDSGTISLPAGALINVVAVTNTGTGDSPVSLMAININGSSQINDVNAPADLRVFHLSPDAPAVDVVVNDNFSAPLLSNISFPLFSDYLTVPATEYNVKVVATGTQTPAVIDADLTLTPASSYSVLAVNTLANIEPLVLTDQRRSISTEAQLRIIHASPAAGLVDLYLFTPGTDINTVEPNFTGVDFKQDTGYLSLAEDDYEVIVTAQGSKDAAIGPASITLNNGGIYTIMARDNIGGGAPLNVVLADDFTNTQ